MRVADPITLSSEQRSVLEQQARARSLPARQVSTRALCCGADGLQNKDITGELGITQEKVASWRRRFLNGGFAGWKRTHHGLAGRGL